jgi:hypothetical protein
MPTLVNHGEIANPRTAATDLVVSRPNISDQIMVGATGIEPVTPTMSRKKIGCGPLLGISESTKIQ